MASSVDVAVKAVSRHVRLLEDDGLLRRTHGGACPTEGHRFEPPLELWKG